MGVVYRAADDRLGRSAAVKVIAPGQAEDAAFRRRFIEESRAAAAIDHPNVLPVYAAGEEDEVLFLVTRLVEGPDLATLLEQGGAMAPARALELVAQVAAALDAAHARGLIHRDVKPANVLVARDPGPGTEHCYLTDFGLAQQGDQRSRLTTTGQFVGTLDYIAPEQIQGEKVDGRADVYALAALFYECATGTPPFVRDSQPALLFAHLSDSPPAISERAKNVPEELDGVIARAMAKSPDERFDSCSEFVAAARAALGGSVTVAGSPAKPLRPAETVAARRPGATKPGRRPPPGRRRMGPRRWAALAAILVAGGLAWALLGGGGGGGGGGADSSAALRLSTETISLAGEVGDDTERLAESVQSGGPTSDLVGALERSQARASDLRGRLQSELDPGDPGRGDLRRSSGNLKETSAHLAVVAAGPTAAGARSEAGEAKRTMSRALTGVDRALVAQRRAFASEGATEAASSVQQSLTRLRGGREPLIAPFDALIGAL
jgi:Protein kinase domain